MRQQRAQNKRGPRQQKSKFSPTMRQRQTRTDVTGEPIPSRSERVAELNRQWAAESREKGPEKSSVVAVVLIGALALVVVWALAFR